MDPLDAGPLARSLDALRLSAYPSAKIKIDELFLTWLSSDGIPSIQNIIDSIENGKISSFHSQPNSSSTTSSSSSGHPSRNGTVSSSDSAPRSPKNSDAINNTANTNSNVFSQTDAPPRSPNKRSPKKRTQSEMLSRTSSEQSSTSHISDPGDPSTASVSPEDTPDNPHVASRRRNSLDSLPPFFVPGQPRWNRKVAYNPAHDSLHARMDEISAFFAVYPLGIPIDKFVHVTKRLVQIPSFFNAPLVKRIVVYYDDSRRRTKSDQSPVVTLKAFLKYWEKEVAPYDRVTRFFNTIKQPGAKYIVNDDFLPFLQELLHFHPGREFLDGTEEFQRKYALSVIARIFYAVNTSCSGRLSLKEVVNSNLFNAFMHVDEENDINKVLEFFSYEHFYVLYCRFYELDTDKNGLLSRDDLVRYGDHALSEQLIDRVFQKGRRAFTDGKQGYVSDGAVGMTFADFVFFMLAEEDKTTAASLKYWFECCDMDDDGMLSTEEMRHFYKSQLHRVTSLSQEGVPFQDVLCQLVDLIDPADPRNLTLKDFTRPEKRPLSGLLFDVLFNLHKFMRFETRDPFQEKMKREDGFACDWDRFAYQDYQRLAIEEGKEQYDGEMDVEHRQDWPENDELEFDDAVGGGVGDGGGVYLARGMVVRETRKR